ncbi:MAG: hydroxyacid dehydrogenase, partial [Candidatus Omnitrophota bacterium]
MKVLITTSTFAEYDSAPLDMLKARGFEVILNPYKRKLTKEESIKLYGDEISAVIAGVEKIDEDIIRNAKDLKVISRCGTGMDNVDLGSAEKAGIKVFNTPDGPTRAVVELTIGLVLS